jgi:hypothetical protein
MPHTPRSRATGETSAKDSTTRQETSSEDEAFEIDWDEHFEGLDDIDIASALSFPASDPPALSPPPVRPTADPE